MANLKFAKKCEEAGVDAIVAEGFEAGGHNGREETTTMCLIPMLKNIKAQNPLPQYEGLASKFNLQNQNGLGLKNSAIHILQYCENDLYPIKW